MIVYSYQLSDAGESIRGPGGKGRRILGNISFEICPGPQCKGQRQEVALWQAADIVINVGEIATNATGDDESVTLICRCLPVLDRPS